MKKYLSLAAVAALAFTAAACDVDQTQEGDIPEVDVKGGQLPEYDVDAADVDVRTEEKTVDVPVVDIDEADASNE